MPERSRFPVGVNVFVIKDKKLLLIRRRNCAGDGSWGLPGGHLENRENVLDAAARELKEETGLTAERLDFLNLVNDNALADELHYLQIGIVATNPQGEAHNAEPEFCYEIGWFDIKNLPKPVFIGHKNQIKNFLEGKSFADSGKLL